MKLFHKPKNSSHIEHFEHANGIMTVKFKNAQKPYQWKAPVSAFHQMKQAPSAGTYLHANKSGWKQL